MVWNDPELYAFRDVSPRPSLWFRRVSTQQPPKHSTTLSDCHDQVGVTATGSGRALSVFVAQNFSSHKLDWML